MQVEALADGPADAVEGGRDPGRQVRGVPGVRGVLDGGVGASGVGGVLLGEVPDAGLASTGVVRIGVTVTVFRTVRAGVNGVFRLGELTGGLPVVLLAPPSHALPQPARRPRRW